MDKLDNVSKKILDDAEQEKANIIGEAKKKAEGIIREANNKKKEALERAKREAKAEYNKTYELEITEAKSGISQKLLLNKLQLVEEIIDKAKKRRKKRDQDQYKDFLTKSLADLNIREGSFIIGSKEKNISPEIVKEAAGDIKLEESSQQPDFDYGIKVISGNAEYKLSPDTMVDTQIDDLKMEIADFLFGKE